jgi:uncharacterized protein (TIGR02266 family)
MTEHAQERRQHQRVPTKVLIKYSNADQFFTDYIQNISRGGIFVPTHNPFPEGTRLSITFSLPYCDPSITTEGVVIRNIHAAPGDDISPSGMGIQFDALDEEAQKLIDAYINSMLP